MHAGFFLPRGYPHTVTPDYLPFQLWAVRTHGLACIVELAMDGTYIICNNQLLHAWDEWRLTCRRSAPHRSQRM